MSSRLGIKQLSVFWAMLITLCSPQTSFLCACVFQRATHYRALTLQAAPVHVKRRKHFWKEKAVKFVDTNRCSPTREKIKPACRLRLFRISCAWLILLFIRKTPASIIWQCSPHFFCLCHCNYMSHHSRSKAARNNNPVALTARAWGKLFFSYSPPLQRSGAAATWAWWKWGRQRARSPCPWTGWMAATLSPSAAGPCRQTWGRTSVWWSRRRGSPRSCRVRYVAGGALINPSHALFHSIWVTERAFRKAEWQSKASQKTDFAAFSPILCVSVKAIGMHSAVYYYSLHFTCAVAWELLTLLLENWIVTSVNLL